MSQNGTGGDPAQRLEEFKQFQQEFMNAVSRMEEAARIRAVAVSLKQSEYEALLKGLVLLHQRNPEPTNGQ